MTAPMASKPPSDRRAPRPLGSLPCPPPPNRRPLAARTQHAARTNVASGVRKRGGGGGEGVKDGPAAGTNAACLQAATVATLLPPPNHRCRGGGVWTAWGAPSDPPPPRCDVNGRGGGALDTDSGGKALWRRGAAARRPHENWGRPPARARPAWSLCLASLPQRHGALWLAARVSSP